jgi:hypothetical protein
MTIILTLVQRVAKSRKNPPVAFCDISLMSHEVDNAIFYPS